MGDQWPVVVEPQEACAMLLAVVVLLIALLDVTWDLGGKFCLRMYIYIYT